MELQNVEDAGGISGGHEVVWDYKSRIVVDGIIKLETSR